MAPRAHLILESAAYLDVGGSVGRDRRICHMGQNLGYPVSLHRGHIFAHKIENLRRSKEAKCTLNYAYTNPVPDQLLMYPRRQLIFAFYTKCVMIEGFAIEV